MKVLKVFSDKICVFTWTGPLGIIYNLKINFQNIFSGGTHAPHLTQLYVNSLSKN